MNSLQSHEGVLSIDHTGGSPGVPDEIMIAQGLGPGSGQGFFECATFTCSHCEKVVAIYNRKRADELCGFCPGCNHRLCTTCTTKRAHDGICKTMKQIVDEILNKNAKLPRESEVFSSPSILIP